jgi:sporulation protein YlmC with PRC-barrel domain
MMKRVWLFLSIMMIVALVLSACDASGLNNDRPTLSEQQQTATVMVEEGLIPETGEDETLLLEQTRTAQEAEADAGETADPQETAAPSGDDDWDDNDRRDAETGSDDAIPVTGEDERGTQYRVENRDLLALSALKDAVVLNRGGQKIGEIEGVVLDEDRTRVLYLVFERDGGSDRLTAVPLQAFDTEDAVRAQRDRASERGQERGRGHQTYDDRTVLVFDRDENRLQDAPRFSDDDRRIDRSHMEETHRYWGDDSSGVPVTREGEARWYKFDTLEDYHVYDRDRREIEDVEDVVVDFFTGEIRYLLVEADDIYEVFGDDDVHDDDVYLLIPFEYFTREGLDADDRGFILTGDRAALDRANWVHDRQDLYWHRQ